MLNVAGTTEVPLSTFGGLNSELGATDLPMGLSPACSDVAFLPGQVFTRPPLQVYATLGTTAQIVYTYPYLKPDGTVVRFDADSQGRMYANGVQIGQTQAGNRFKCATAFGKLYIAVSDGLHGADVPLQYTPEGYLDRVSQDGPGAPPSLSNYAIPVLNLVAGSAGTGVSISTSVPINPQQVQVSSGNNDNPDYGYSYNPPQYETYYTSLQITTSTVHGLTVGQFITITGDSLYNYPSAVVSAVDSSTIFEIGYFGQGNATGTGGTVTLQAPLLTRNSNTVSASTSTPHFLQTGYQIQISGVTDQVIGGGVARIDISSGTLPGVATIATNNPHGLAPGDAVTLLNVTPVTVGGSITSAVSGSGIQTITTSSPHGLQVGATVLLTIGSMPPSGALVTQVLNATQFVVANAGTGTASSGSVQLELFIDYSTSTYTVLDVPTPTTFTVATSYVNGTWYSGTLTFAWNGTFYVTSVPSSTSFTYRQVGPNGLVQSGSGTVTPLGQITPGEHTCVVIFQTRTGYLTVPSPSIRFTASGSQYIALTNIPIGPSNVVARILAFTSANGGKFFYLPVPPKDPSDNEIIGTSTVINDNTTTSAILDFSDAALLAAIGIDIPGNNLFAQDVLGPCLGFYQYADRLMAWGERNKIQQFLNMGFEGGTLASASNVPLGWAVNGAGTLTAGDYGMAWTPTGTASISQGAYTDQNGIAILQPNTQYTFRCWTTGTVTCQFYSPTAGVLATASVTASGGFSQSNFSAKTPIVMPVDTVIKLSGAAMDELEIIPTAEPYILGLRASYVINPEAFDGITGLFGPDDSHAVISLEERRDLLCILTSGPDGSLYETEDSPQNEPSTWSVRKIASRCGGVSVWGTAKFEDWFCWVSDTGLRIYDGGTVDKISQEVQTLWDSFNPQAKQFTVLANDYNTRRLYILALTGTATVSNTTYVMDYRELNTAGALTSSGTLRVGYSGKVITTDLTRKWCPWTITANHACMMLTNGASEMVFCGGTGGALSDPLHSTIYSLAEGSLTGVDADYGPFWDTSYYTTYFFLAPDDAQQRNVGAHRLLHDFLTLNVSGLGKVFVQPLVGRLDNLGKQTRAVAVTPDLATDREFGLNLAAERISYQLGCVPSGTLPASPTSPAGFRCSQMTLAVREHPYSPIKGWNK